MPASALGRPYDDSRDQPLPGLPEPPAPPPAGDMAARMAAADAARPAAGAPSNPYGLPEPGPDTELPPPTNPMAVGRELIKRARLAGSLPYRFWRGEFWQHTGTHWAPVERAIINKWLYHATENAWYVKKNAKGVYDDKPWSPDRNKINILAHALSDGLLTHEGDEDRCIALQNGVYNIKTDRVDPHGEHRFNLSVLPFAHDKHATCPRWLEFLEQVLPGDASAQAFLAEWFGYVLSGRTDLHKMLSMVGPRRCGKGTIARVLHALLGGDVVASPTLQHLGTSFGEQCLIGRKLAIMSDVRWTGATVAEAVGVLLAVSGEDARDVARKNRETWHGYLPTRFMLMSNDVPNFRDVSGALAGRMMQVQFTQTFLGREDTGLTDTLLTELPGIFNWAIAGLHRLTARGKFAPPASGEQLADEVRRTSSPYQAFLDDFCDLDPDARTAVPDLLRAYGQWARREGRKLDEQTTSSLSRGLRTTCPDIRAAEKRITLPNGQRATVLTGVRLTTAPTWLIGDGADEHALMNAGRYEQEELDIEPPAEE
jgi:putative DNA primase/helicase